ncbi:hypothetical protein C5S29_10555 [ANME-1 cluster archaeon GoMg3.2]|nr:hypothetical protein [ANME-1 cluster archaeon GoMg3.2]
MQGICVVTMKMQDTRGGWLMAFQIHLLKPLISLLDTEKENKKYNGEVKIKMSEMQ